jgi:hypothetical protein
MCLRKTALIVLAFGLVGSSQVLANGCIVVRPTSNLAVGLDDAHASRAGQFELTTAYRYLHSDRHFRGSHEEKHRQEEGSDVRNTLHTIDTTLSYWTSDRLRFSASLPYTDAERSSLYEHDRINRYTMRARGIGDLRLMAYREMLAVDDMTRGLTLGFGLKLPTGRYDVKDIAYRPDGPELRNVDQSIQLGDGGLGVILELNAFTSVFDERTYLFGSASYLINPRDTNGASTHRSRPAESVQSVPDTYQARVGLTRVFRTDNPFSVDASLRIEGVPWRDLIGRSNGFRRPGYAVYFEPAANYQVGNHRFNLSLPIAIERNRIKSKSDRESGRHGDAAFADYILMASYSFRWD